MIRDNNLYSESLLFKCTNKSSVCWFIRHLLHSQRVLKLLESRTWPSLFAYSCLKMAEMLRKNIFSNNLIFCLSDLYLFVSLTDPIPTMAREWNFFEILFSWQNVCTSNRALLQGSISSHLKIRFFFPVFLHFKTKVLNLGSQNLISAFCWKYS